MLEGLVRTERLVDSRVVGTILDKPCNQHTAASLHVGIANSTVHGRAFNGR